MKHLPNATRFLFIGLVNFTLCIEACTAGSQRKRVIITESESLPPATAATPASNNRLRIMSYNVLKYGDGCQAPPDVLHKYLGKIIRYADPDIVGLVKVAAIPTSGAEGKAPTGFDAAICDKAFNTAFAGRYAVCPFTNKADGNNVNLLFYDKHKLGYAGMQTLLSDETDFNLFRLYLLSSARGGGQSDTAFVYVLLNHTQSGDKSGPRDAQMQHIAQALHARFKSLPDMIDMGDFNLRNTEEPGYKSLVAGTPGFRFEDPPFAIDQSVSYPADWENNPEQYAAFLTTSTRKNEGEPNDCGTGGGAKFWFDHILLSQAIAEGKGRFRYVPKSFRVIGNDGARIGHSVNAGKHPNTAIPPEIADALFQFSNKYPVMLELEIPR